MSKPTDDGKTCPVTHLTTEQLLAGLDAIRQSPSEAGTVELIVPAPRPANTEALPLPAPDPGAGASGSAAAGVTPAVIAQGGR